MTGDLAAWLLEQIAADEQVARAATAAPWVFSPEELQVGPRCECGRDDCPKMMVACYEFDDDGEPVPAEANGHHIATWDPARVLAECEAKRQLIKWARRWPLRPSRPSDEDQILGLLALPYADRPAYREEWRP